MQSKNESIEVGDKAVWKFGSNLGELRLEVGYGGGRVVERKDKLCKDAVVDASVIEQFCCDLACEGEKFELVELVVCFGCHTGQNEVSCRALCRC